MNDDFRLLNRRNRRRYDRWFYKTQWVVGILFVLCILAEVIHYAR